MVKIPYEQVVEKIREEKGLSDEDINQKIKEKMDKLSGLISKEGAAFIIANELGVKLVQTSGKVKIKDILVGMRNIETAAKVMRKFPVHEFERNGSKGRVQSLIIADETGETRLTCWHDQVESASQISEGDVIKIMNAYVRDNNGNAEIHMNAQSKVVMNPSDVKIDDVKSNVSASSAGGMQSAEGNRKQIKDLTENDQNAEIVGTIVQVFEPRFYPVCPECNRKVNSAENKFSCSTHGDVDPNYSYVMNVFIDDGTDNMRAVFFKNQAQALLKKDDSHFTAFRENPSEFEDYKTALLGEQIKIVGRVQRNTMFDRLEIISSQVFMDINPDDEIKKLQEQFPDAQKEKPRTAEKPESEEIGEEDKARPSETDSSEALDDLEKEDTRKTDTELETEAKTEEKPEEKTEEKKVDDKPEGKKEEKPDEEVFEKDDAAAEKNEAESISDEVNQNNSSDEPTVTKNETSPENIAKEQSSSASEPMKESSDVSQTSEISSESGNEEEKKVSADSSEEEKSKEASAEAADNDNKAEEEKKKQGSDVSDDEIEDLLDEIENTPSIDDI